MKLAFLKSKKFYIPAALVVVFVSAYVYGSYKRGNQPVTYDTIKAVRQNLEQTVEATGKIESANDLSLRFEIGGTLDAISVKEGDTVKEGQVLANLKMSDLNAAVSQASANLNQRLAGATTQERDYYKAAVDMAKASLDQTQTDTASALTAAKANLETAKNNLKLAEGGENSQIVNNAYDNAVAVLQSSLSTLSSALNEADNIMGIDNPFANDAFESALSVLDTMKKNTATEVYTTAKDNLNKFKTATAIVNLGSPHNDIDNALALGETAFGSVNKEMVSVSEVLDASLPIGGLTQTSLEAKKSAIAAARLSVNAGYTSLLSKKQAISDAKNSYSTYQIAYDKAVSDLNTAEATSYSSIAAKQAAYNQAVANYQGKTVAPREVDVAYYRAALAQAVAARDKAVIKAPIEGVVVKVNKKKGEMVGMTDTVIQMLSPHYEVKVDIPETDVPKIKVGDPVAITLDAFGDEVKFTGKIQSIEPASTVIQDVVYYNITITLDETETPIRPGMTANAIISTAKRENALVVPSRAVRTNGQKYVRVLKDGKEIQAPVVVGLKGDNGLIEVLEGVSEGDEIIVSVKTAK